jgi:XTP/dITP diphosphohydrolase
MTMKIVIATLNRDKFKQIQDILKDVPVELIPSYECDISTLENTGPSFVEKALIKARHAAKCSGLPSIADDTGLAVDALGGAPGIHSSHYAGPHTSEAENREKVLKAIANLEGNERAARYYCAIAFVVHAADPMPIICQAHWEGLLLKSPSAGTVGYGYDSIFYVPEHRCTVAELTPAQLNQYSPRARAFRKLATHLPSLNSNADE